MAIFNITVWQGKPHEGSPVWQANVLAPDVEEGYRIGKTRFGVEHPELKLEDYTIVADGDSVEKSISV